MKLFSITPPPSAAFVQIEMEKEGEPLTHITVGKEVIPIMGDGPEIWNEKTDKGEVVLTRNDNRCWEDESRCLAVITVEEPGGLSGFEGVNIIARGNTAGGYEVLALVMMKGTFFLRFRRVTCKFYWDGTKWTKELRPLTHDLDLLEGGMLEDMCPR